MFYIWLADRPLQIYTTSSNKRFLNSSVYPAAQCVRQKASLEVFLFSYAFFLLFALCTDCLSPPSFAFVLFFKNFGYEFLVPFPFLNCRPIPPLGLGTTRFSFAFFFFILSNTTIKRNIFVPFCFQILFISRNRISPSLYQKLPKPFSHSHPFAVSIADVPCLYRLAPACFSLYILPLSPSGCHVCSLYFTVSILPAVWLFRFAANLPLRLCKTSSLPL